jgi:hypothetical protein
MNYRLTLPLEDILQHIKARAWPVLRNADQLARQRSQGAVFFGFEEGVIDFAPTYRYERGTRERYASQKQKATHVKINVPSWCDRVLWRSFPHTEISQVSLFVILFATFAVVI